MGKIKRDETKSQVTVWNTDNESIKVLQNEIQLLASKTAITNIHWSVTGDAKIDSSHVAVFERGLRKNKRITQAFLFGEVLEPLCNEITKMMGENDCKLHNLGIFNMKFTNEAFEAFLHAVRKSKSLWTLNFMFVDADDSYKIKLIEAAASNGTTYYLSMTFKDFNGHCQFLAMNAFMSSPMFTLCHAEFDIRAPEQFSTFAQRVCQANESVWLRVNGKEYPNIKDLVFFLHSRQILQLDCG